MSDIYRPPTFAAPIDLDLSRNEGRATVTGISLDPREAAELTSRYPDTSHLRSVLAERNNVRETEVLVTAGGDDALFRCFLATAGGNVVATTPSFEMIRRYADQARSALTECPWWLGDFPVDDFIDSRADMAVIVSPNNPTGSVVTQADLRKVASEVDLVVLDAAYTEFADEDLTPSAFELGNVVVVRSLSKAFGLAGLRVGYLIGPEDLVAWISGFGSPYSLSALSAALAADLLEQVGDASAGYVANVGTERARLIDLLDELGCSPLPSQANFVLATTVDADWLVSAAASLGIGLRGFDGRPDLDRCVRIGLPGEDHSFARLQSTLRAVLGPEALLFDMDGVLADVRESFRRAIVETAALFGVDVTVGEIAATKAAGNASDDWELTRSLCASAGVDVTLEEVRERFEQVYHGDGTQPGLKANESLLVDPANLERWARQFSLGIVTARPRRDAIEFLERFDITGFFSAVVTREDAPSKPDPAPVCLALERLGVSWAWMCGDTVDDVRSAAAAGVVPIGVAVPGDDAQALSGAARILESVNQIQEVLDVTRS